MALPVRDGDVDVVREAIATYGQLMEPNGSNEQSGDRLVEFVISLLEIHGVTARKSRPGVLTGRSTIAALLPSGDHLIEVAGIERPVSRDELVAAERAAQLRPPLRSVLLSISGYEPAAISALAETVTHLVLLDRQHLEAILCGLRSPQLLLADAAQRAFFDGQPYNSLTSMLTEDLQDLPSCATPDRVPPPWDLVQAVSTDVKVRQVLSGQPGWPDVTGLAHIDEHRLLVTTPEGILEVNPRRGNVDSFLPIRGCRGTPLVLPDGAVLTICNDAVVRWRDGVAAPIAGGFGDAVNLVAGANGTTWLLSGHGGSHSGDSGTLALSQVGSQVGQQQTYYVRFNAHVKAASWITDRKFFLLADGNSAIVDLAHTSAVDNLDWIPTPQGYAHESAMIHDRTVVITANDPSGVSVGVHQTDLVTRQSHPLAVLALSKVCGMTVGAEGTIFLIGDVRGNEVHLSRLVFVRIRPAPHRTGLSHHIGDAATPAQLDPRHEIRLLARGSRRDYALDPQPIERGGQATITGARHKATGHTVAFKQLNMKSEEQKARMRREIEAAQLFGDSIHIVPVLDFSPAYDWFVMPLASGSAQPAADELMDTAALRQLVVSICEALRRPHALGWIHRDLKPANILRFGDVWAVADWGLGRRPRGRTSHPGRTQLGALYGTEGFAAPELYHDAHAVGPQADIYSIGQIIGWALTGKWPQANRPLLPAAGPWRSVVEIATYDDPALRFQTVDDLLSYMDAQLSGSTSPIDPQKPHVVALPPPPPPTAVVSVKGILGTVSFDGDAITIQKDGFGPRMKGKRVVRLSEIERIDVKPATRLFHGYIQLIVRGKVPAPILRGLFWGGRPHFEDPDSLSFKHRNNGAIEFLQQRISLASGRFAAGIAVPGHLANSIDQRQTTRITDHASQRSAVPNVLAANRPVQEQALASAAGSLGLPAAPRARSRVLAWIGRSILWAAELFFLIGVLVGIWATATGVWSRPVDYIGGNLCYGVPFLVLTGVTIWDSRRLYQRYRSERERPGS